jgi:predicted transcriptional regulator
MPRTDWKNRSRLEIIGNILGVAKYGAKKTHIMYRANLSYSQLQEYVSFLTERGLLEEVNGERADEIIFQTSNLGIQFLRYFRELERLVASPNEMRFAANVVPEH